MPASKQSGDKWLALAMLLAGLSCLYACHGQKLHLGMQWPQDVAESVIANTDQVENAPVGRDGLPNPSQIQALNPIRVASEGNIVIGGGDVEDSYGENGADPRFPDSIILRPYDDQDVAWALYAFDGLTDLRPIKIEVSIVPIDPGGEEDLPLVFWLAAADFSHDTWQWFGPYEQLPPYDDGFELNIPEELNSYARRQRYSNPDGLVYITALTDATDIKTQVTVKELSLFTLSATSPELIQTVPAAANVTAADPNFDSLTVTLQWAHIADTYNTAMESDKYTIYRRRWGSSEKLEVGETDAPNTQYQDSDLQADEIYFYSIQASNEAGATNPSAEWNVSFALAPPEHLTASEGNASKVTVSWDESPHGPPPDGYYVYRSAVYGLLGEQIAEVAGGYTTYDDVPSDTEIYYYAAKSFRSGYSTSPESNQDSGSKLTYAPAISSVQPLAGISGESAEFSALNTGGEVESWLWDLGDAVIGYSSSSATPSGAWGNPGDYPGCSVNVINAAGNDQYFFMLSVDPPIPSPPTGVTASKGTSATEISISWDSTAWADEYSVYRSTTPTGTYTLLQGGISDTFYYDSSADYGSEYWYKIKAGNASGWSGTSTAVNGWRKLPAPTGVSATTGTSSPTCDVDWNNVSGASLYKVYRSPTEGYLGDLVGTPIGSEYQETPPQPGVYYYYSVVANCPLGDSDPSEQVSGWAAPPMKPTAVSTQDMGSFWRVSFTRPYPRDGCKFWLYYYQGSDVPPDWGSATWTYTGGSITSSSFDVPKTGYSGSYRFGIMTRRLDYLPEWNEYFDSHMGISSNYVTN